MVYMDLMGFMMIYHDMSWYSWCRMRYHEIYKWIYGLISMDYHGLS